jgi:hypothetical protein
MNKTNWMTLTNAAVGKLLVLILVFALSATTFAETPASVKTIASYAHGAFLENLSVDPNGRLLFTSYINQTLMRWDGRSAPTPLVKLGVHPVAVLARANDIIVSAHAKSFMDGPAFSATNQLLVLDRNGALKKRVAAPNARFLNGMVEISPELILIADSIAGTIWRFNPSTGLIDTWLADPLLAADPAQASKKPGANGLKLHDGWLYVSNSARGTIHRVRLASGLPKGALALYATPGAVDDFTFLADGTIAAATHGAKLIQIGKDGVLRDILADGCDSCTSVTSYGPQGDLIVLTTGNLLEGGDAPARVLRVSSPVR